MCLYPVCKNMRKNSGVLCNAAVPGKYGKGWHRFCRHSSRRGPRESCLACGGFPGISHFRVVYADMLCHYYCCRTRDAAVLAGSAANRSKLISSNPACTPGSTCERVLFSFLSRSLSRSLAPAFPGGFVLQRCLGYNPLTVRPESLSFMFPAASRRISRKRCRHHARH